MPIVIVLLGVLIMLLSIIFYIMMALGAEIITAFANFLI